LELTKLLVWRVNCAARLKSVLLVSENSTPLHNNPERTLHCLIQGGGQARHNLQHKITRLQLHRLTATGTVRRPSRSTVVKLLADSLEDRRIKSSKLLAHTIHVRMRMKTLKLIRQHCHVRASSGSHNMAR
jgi:hypothetical protein